jgi:hypothetical protein
MPFVARNPSGTIEAVFADARPFAEERLPADAPELQVFFSQLCRADDARERLSETDSDMVRLLEDLIEVLMSKGVVAWDDFSLAAQRKLLVRKDLRWQLHHNPMGQS